MGAEEGNGQAIKHLLQQRCYAKLGKFSWLKFFLEDVEEVKGHLDPPLKLAVVKFSEQRKKISAENNSNDDI